MQSIPIWKITATAGGAALTLNAVWLNACHVAGAEGWHSPLVSAGIIVTVCAAGTPPLAERAAKTGQPLKAVLLWIFFTLAIGFSLSASISRSSGYADGKIAAAEKIGERAQLAKESYTAAQATVADECKRRGPRCRAAEDAVAEARRSLVMAAPTIAANAGAERVSAVLGIQEATVQLYSPLMLPLALELGGFILLALGLAPAARRREIEAHIATPVATEPVADEVAEPCSATVNVGKTASTKGGSAYYVARLQRDFPALAAKVHDGEMSVYAASVAAGLRKPAGKKWTSPADYGIETATA